MIPKVIHYCWFGHNKKPELAEKCIASWPKYCPDYEIVEWNESNFDISSAPIYVQQAYSAKKWAFVTDYVRLWAMTAYGGIYMDTDVELVRSPDLVLEHEAVSGFESQSQIPTGLMACREGFPLFEEFLHYYDDAVFRNSDGTLNMTTNVEIITEICLKHGFVPNGKYQVVDGFALYPRDVFCPIDYQTGHMNITENTISIHWFSASWVDESAKKYKRQLDSLARFVGHHNADVILGVMSCVKKEGVTSYVAKRVKRYIKHE